jgi:RNA polymerase sigma-54 factor
MLHESSKDKETVKYIRSKINSAKFLIKSIFMRNRTLERVMRSIIHHQRNFFYNNSGLLDPLTYSVIANDLNVNESTISRVVKQKYADTPFGIMCLKDFFCSAAGKDKNYESVSRQNVQIQIEEMINNEDKYNPLSDQELVDILKERGISVSRRVIAKYREEMKIPNSRLRRK